MPPAALSLSPSPPRASSSTLPARPAAVPVVAGSGARVPTQFLDQKGSFARPKKDLNSSNGHDTNQTHTNGHASSSRTVGEAVDLTADDGDDFTVLEARGPNMIQDPEAKVCIGLVNAVVLTMLGLPPSFVAPPAVKLSDYNAHPRWSPSEWPSGSEFFLEPGYRPVEAVPRGAGTPMSRLGEKPEIHIHEIVPPFDVKAQLEGTGQPIPKGPQYRLSSFGTLAEKYNRGLHTLVSRKLLSLSSRCRIVAPNSGSNFLHAVELLCFTARKDVEKVSNFLFCENIQLEYPHNYKPSQFAGHPPLEMLQRKVPNIASPYSRFMLQSRGTVMHTKEATEQEKKRQVDAVYASLRDGEDLEMVEASECISTPLLPHQKQALAFILDREKQRSFLNAEKGEIVSLWKPVKRGDRILSYENVVTQGEQKRAPHICRGAILADDMGLGKTLVAISLISSTFDQAAKFELEGEDGEESTGETKALLAPVGSDDDADDDVTIEDFNINVHGAPPPKKAKTNKPKKKGKREQKKEDTASARKEEIVTRSRATLVVLPLTLVSAWESQIEEHWDANRLPSIYIYHGTGRMTDAKEVSDHDIVMTTYATLATEFASSIQEEESDEEDEGGRSKTIQDDDDIVALDYKGEPIQTFEEKKQQAEKVKKAKRKKRKANDDHPISPLQQIEWFRIILDEAHTIKEARTLQSRAVCNLLATRRVCLTGTPVQNRIDDLFSLLRFLRLEPFDDRAVWNQFCGSNERAASLRSSRKGNNDKNNEPLDKMALARVQTIMKFLTLRRTKETQMANGERILTLPPKYSRILTLKFDDRERGTYDDMRSRYKDDFEQMKAQDTLKHNYATILHEISNLRMTCDHMGLVDASKDAKRKKEFAEVDDNPASAILRDGLSRDRAINLFDLLCSSDRARCRLCEHDLTNFAEEGNSSSSTVEGGKAPVITRCLHLFCSDCLKTQIGVAQYDKPKADDRFACPECAETIAPLLEMRELLPADVGGDVGDRTMSADTFGCDRGMDLRHRPDYSSKIKALVSELEAFSRCNPSSLLYDDQAPVLDQVAAQAEEGDVSLAEPVLLVSSAENSHINRPLPIKSVIFSQWTKMLDRIAKATHRAGIKAAYLDGRMRRQERSDNLEKFKMDESVEVLLVSLKAGGIGLNLVSACRAYLMEPYWNPAIENQGLDRVHRMGQMRPVVTTKFIMNNSIEENMLELQRRKLKLAESVGEKRNAERQREELNLLFSTREEEKEEEDDDDNINSNANKNNNGQHHSS